MIVKGKSRLLAVTLVFAFLIGFAPVASAANELTLSAAGSTSLEVGTKVQLSVSAGDPVGTLSWSSSDPSIASVVNTGEVTAVAAGSATIIVADASTPAKTGSVNITVTAATPTTVAVTGVSVSPSTLDVPVGGTGNLTATVSPANATDKAVQWSTSNASIATVDANGKVTAVSKTVGAQATITATTVDGGKTAQCVVTLKSSSAKIISASNGKSIAINGTTTLTLSNLLSSETVTWEVRNGSTSTASVDKTSGKVTGHAAGTVTVVAVVTTNGVGTEEISVDITVTGATIAVTGVELDKTKITIDVDEKYTLDATVRPTNASNTNVTWKSSDSKIATVTTSGRVTGVKEGTATITVTTASGGKTATCKVTVEKGGGSSKITYSVDKNKTLYFDASDFNDYCKDENGENMDYITFDALPTTSRGVLYYDDDTKVTTSTKYYRSGSGKKKLDDVCFEPKNGYEGTVSIKFTGYDVEGDKFTGTITIRVGDSDDDGDITYSGTQNKTVDFKLSDFTKFCKDEVGGTVDYIEFDTLPSSSRGVVYYDDDTKAKTGAEYARSKIDQLSFEPYKDYTGTFSFDFSGANTNGDEFYGTITITIKKGTDTTGTVGSIVYSSNGGAVTFNKSDFISACSKRNGEALESVKFTLPSNYYGTLYYSYVSPTSFGGSVSSSTDFDTGTGSYSLSNVTFVPSSGYSGTVVITYVGTDEEGDTYTGAVSIVVNQPTAPVGFTDMSNHAWALTAVNALHQKGIVSGMTATTYGPAENLKRGDFILMLYRAFNLTAATTTDNFSDVAADKHYAEAIAVAKALGIAQGSDGAFRPEDSLTREDAMVLIHRTLGVVNKTVMGTTTTTLDSFPDAGNTSAYARDAVDTLVRAGIVTGDDYGNLSPKKSLTRAEMAVILYRVVGN